MRLGGVLPLVIALLTVVSGTFAQSAVQEERLFVEDEILVAFHPGLAGEMHRNNAPGREIRHIEKINVSRRKLPPGLSVAEAVERLSRNPNVYYAEPNGIGQSALIPNDPSLGSQWALTKIEARQAWDVTVGSSLAPVAVIDSGVNAVPDLLPKIIVGWNTYDNDANYADVHGHGTAVAGVIGASTNNGQGVAGLGWYTPIIVIRDTNLNGTFVYSDAAEAIVLATDFGAKVINLSQGGTSPSSVLQDAVNYALARGVVIVAAAGNTGAEGILYPAALPGVIAVGATDQNDNRASWSSYGAAMGVAAPGVSILTTQAGGDYGYWQGTSFSSPHVAGLAALLFSARTGITNSEVVAAIKGTAIDLGVPGPDALYGSGRINARTAVYSISTTYPTPARTALPTALPTSTAPSTTCRLRGGSGKCR